MCFERLLQAFARWQPGILFDIAAQPILECRWMASIHYATTYIVSSLSDILLTLRHRRYFANRKHPRGWCNPWIFAFPSEFCENISHGYVFGVKESNRDNENFYLHCMTLKIKVKHLSAWSFISVMKGQVEESLTSNFKVIRPGHVN